MREDAGEGACSDGLGGEREVSGILEAFDGLIDQGDELCDGPNAMMTRTGAAWLRVGGGDFGALCGSACVHWGRGKGAHGPMRRVYKACTFDYISSEA